MGSMSRHSRGKRFIATFGDAVKQSVWALPAGPLVVVEQGLVFDSPHEVVRYGALLKEPETGREVEVFLADWSVVFDPEFYERDEEIEALAELLGMDERLVEKMFTKAGL